MSVKTVTGYLAAALATNGTITVSYPAGTTRGDFVLGIRHRLSIGGKNYAAPEGFTIALNAASAVVTYLGATTIPPGSRFTVELDRNTDVNNVQSFQKGPDGFIQAGQETFMAKVSDYAISLGSPSALSTTAIVNASAVAGAGAVALNGGKLVGAVVPLGAPTGRAVQVVSSNAGDTTQTVTVKGKDMYGQNMRQDFALNGTTPVIGTKAFATVTSVSASAALAGNLSVGDSDVLGLPVYLSNATFVWRETQDGALATSGTLVAGLSALPGTATATNGDVRGTYKPNAATDGSKGCVLVAAIPDPTFFGQPQYYA